MTSQVYSNLPQLGTHDQGANSEKGGYACVFARPPPHVLQTECPICHLIIREPHQVTCCGNSFCHSCIKRIKDSSKRCPTCNTDGFSDFPDKRLRDNLNACKVHCNHQKDGCKWTGELGKLDIHLNKNPQPGKGCQFVEVDCSFKCGDKLQRQYMQNHQTEHCPKRPFSCEHCHNYESTYDDVIHNHWPVCGYFPLHCPNECGLFPQRQNIDNHVNNECLLTTINCDFHHVGCTVKLPRKDMPEHIKESLHRHMTLLVTSHAKQQAQIASLIAENERLKRTNEESEYEEIRPLQQHILRAVPAPATQFTPCTVIPMAPPTLIMTHFSKHKKNKDRWHSPPIYTHHHGYKICLRVDANGTGAGKGTHVSVQVIFIRGEFDDSLKWPFRGLISLQLIDQVEGRSHAICTMVYDDTVSDVLCGKVTRGEVSEAGLETPRFIAHAELEPKYLQKDSLFFQIYRVELK